MRLLEQHQMCVCSAARMARRCDARSLREGLFCSTDYYVFTVQAMSTRASLELPSQKPAQACGLASVLQTARQLGHNCLCCGEGMRREMGERGRGVDGLLDEGGETQERRARRGRGRGAVGL